MAQVNTMLRMPLNGVYATVEDYILQGWIDDAYDDWDVGSTMEETRLRALDDEAVHVITEDFNEDTTYTAWPSRFSGFVKRIR